MQFHDLRHTCATLLLLKGVHPKFVQNLLGHSSNKTTLDLYSHWMSDMGSFTADAMDHVLRLYCCQRGPIFVRAPLVTAIFFLQTPRK